MTAFAVKIASSEADGLGGGLETKLSGLATKSVPETMEDIKARLGGIHSWRDVGSS
jgi:hypothetical protein